MKPPPGRAGRLWLVRRLEVARRGADVLDQKRRALLREQHRLEQELGPAEDEWMRRARAAREANARALAIVGERRLRLAAAHCRAPAELDVAWQNLLGAASPRSATVTLAAPPDLVALGGPSVAISAAAHREALEAASAFAALRAAREAIGLELTATNRRLRAIERRWIPQYRHALAALDLALDESERDDISRVRWALDAAGRPVAEGTTI